MNIFFKTNKQKRFFFLEFTKKRAETDKTDGFFVQRLC